ncbi:MAG: hypothetical protein J1F35_05050 [Erysipelotrichales bacterium]|nr:hypothetical protein [Erysipelotrichales bacterium]
MKCFNCNKYIPDVSTVCPYCNEPVDSERVEVVDFGDINNTNYTSDKFDIKVYIKEPKNRKIVIGAIALIFFVIVIFIALVMSMFTSPEQADYKVFTKVVNGLSEYLEDNFVGSKYSANGKYRTTLKINEEQIAFEGDYSYDVKNKVVNLTGMMRDPKEATGEVLIDTKDFEFNMYLKDNNIYFQSDEIYGSDYIYLPIEDNTGLLSTKNYDIYSLVIGGLDALSETFKVMNYKTEKDTITYLGDDLSVNKRSLILDNKNKLKFIKTLLTNLKEDVNFVNEMARIQNKKSDEIVNTLENYITTSEYKYSSDSEYQTTISVYFTNKKIYRIEVDMDEEEKTKYIFDIGETKYYLDYFKDDKNVFSLTFASNIKELDEIIEKTYDITLDTDEYVTDINLYLEEQKQTRVNKQEIEVYKNIKEFTLEDYEKIRSNANYYLKNISFIDTIEEYYKEKCTPDLNCVCNPGEEECNCTYNDKIITCPVNLVQISE